MKKHTFVISALLAAGLAFSLSGLAGCSTPADSPAEEAAGETETDADGNPVGDAEDGGEDSSGEGDAAESEPLEVIGPARIQVNVREVETDFRDENDGTVLVHLTNIELSPGTAESEAYLSLSGRLKSENREELAYRQDVLKKAIKACMDEYAAHSETFTTMKVGIDVIMGRTDDEIVSFMKKEYSDLDGESPFWTYEGISIDPKSGDNMKLGSILTDQEIIPEILARELAEQYPEAYERLCPPPPETKPEETAKEEEETAEGGEEAGESEAETEPETEPVFEPDPAVVKAVKECLKRYSGNGEQLWMAAPEGLVFYFAPFALGAGSSEQILAIRQADYPELFKLSPVNYPLVTVRNRAEERIIPAEMKIIRGTRCVFDVDKDVFPGLANAMADYETDVTERLKAALDEAVQGGAPAEGSDEEDSSDISTEEVISILADNVTADINTLTFDEVTVRGGTSEEERTTFTYDIRTGKKK